MAKTKLGIITTGMGPRTEYLTFHANFLKHLGVDVEIVARHALDGLGREQIRAMESAPGEPVIGCHYRHAGATGDRMGDDWSHCWIRPTALVPVYQKYIDELEAEGVVGTVLCCIEEYGADDFRSRRFFLQPWMLMTDFVKNFTNSMQAPKIGLLIPDEEHYDQDKATWVSQPWMSKLTLTIEPKKGRLKEALKAMRDAHVDLVLNWGYGYGIAPRDDPATIPTVEDGAGAPFLTPQRMVGLAVRDMLRPSMNDKSFVPDLPTETAA